MPLVFRIQIAVILWMRWLRNFFKCTARARFRGSSSLQQPAQWSLLACNDEIDYFTIDTTDDTYTSQFNAALHPLIAVRSPRKNLCAKPDFEAIRREPWDASQNRHFRIPFEFFGLMVSDDMIMGFSRDQYTFCILWSCSSVSLDFSRKTFCLR